MAHVQDYANGVFLDQKRSGAGNAIDAELATENDLSSVEQDPDRAVDSEALGARHRRRYGYSAEGAEENDSDILSQGRAPLRIDGPRKQQNVGESRIEHFKHAIVTTRHPTTVVSRG
jgi:hypothetical protein